MSEKKKFEKFDHFATVFGFLTDAGQVMTWIMGLFSIVVVASQDTTPQIPVINVELGIGYQFTLWACALLAYFHFLRHYHQSLKTNHKSVSSSFNEFVFVDLPNFQHPILLAPLLVFFVVGIGVVGPTDERDDDLLMLYTLVWLLILAFTLYRIYKKRKQDEEEAKQRYYETIFDHLDEKWIARIQKRLAEKGLVTTYDFGEIGIDLTTSWGIGSVNSSLKKYFEKFEIEQDLNLKEQGNEIVLFIRGQYIADN